MIYTVCTTDRQDKWQKQVVFKRFTTGMLFWTLHKDLWLHGYFYESLNTAAKSCPPNTWKFSLDMSVQNGSPITTVAIHNPALL